MTMQCTALGPGAAAHTPAAPISLSTPVLLDRAAGFDRGRSVRVMVLVVAIIALSAGDLAMTLTFLRSVGMGEANPLARFVIEYNSPALLVVWKAASVLLACMIFTLYRRKRCTEVACWCAVAILAWLTVRWWNYASEAGEIAPHLSAIAQAADRTNWVQLSQ